MMHGFELFFDCDNKHPELTNTNWVLTNWVDYMDPNAMTTMLGDTIFNIEEEEYWEACQHALKNPYEARTDDESDEGREVPSDDNEGSGGKDDNSGNRISDDNGDSDDGNDKSNDSDSEKSSNEDYDSQDNDNDKGEHPNYIEDEDAGAFNEDNFDDDVDYYDGDIKDDAEAKDGDTEDDAEVEGEDYDEYPYRRPSD